MTGLPLSVAVGLAVLFGACSATATELEELQAIRIASEATRLQVEALNSAVQALQESQTEDLQTLYLGLLCICLVWAFFNWLFDALP